MSKQSEAFAPLDSFIGKKLKDDVIAHFKDQIRFDHYIVTRPDHYKGYNTHINMYIYVNEDGRIDHFDGDKCYGYYSGMYNRSHNTYDRPFTQKDIAYLKRYVKQITEP